MVNPTITIAKKTSRPTLAVVPELPCTGVRKNCPCKACIADRKRYRHERHRGQYRTVDAQPVREHLARLAAAGIGKQTIAKAVGVAEGTLQRIVNGETGNVRISTAKAVLAFDAADAAKIANGVLIDSTATIKRLRALRAQGYSQAWISQRCGRERIYFGVGERIQRSRALAVLELCKEVREIPGPCAKAAAWARNRGWKPVAEYDEDLFYDPEWDGSEPAVAFECAAFRYVEEYDFLTSQSLDVDTIAARQGIKPSYLRSLVYKRNRGDYPFGHPSEDETSLVG